MSYSFKIQVEAVVTFPFPFDFLLLKIGKNLIFPNFLEPFEGFLGPLVLVRRPDIDILASERFRVAIVCS